MGFLRVGSDALNKINELASMETTSQLENVSWSWSPVFMNEWLEITDYKLFES